MEMEFEISGGIEMDFCMGESASQETDRISAPIAVISDQLMPVCGQTNAGGGVYVNF